MKAAVYSRYGPPDVLDIRDVDKPVPKDDEVLIKVRAASINPLDWRLMRGRPYPLRIVTGLPNPNTRPGHDVAGQVEAVGGKVMHVRPGDQVFGAAAGSLAEYACASATKLAFKPDTVTFEQAAAAPIAALSALQGLRDNGKIQAGQKVLINGAAGGVGTFAVQIAKCFGAQVTGVCSTKNVDLVRSIGAERVIDYTQQDFTQGTQRYDLILDNVGNHSLSACRRVLNPNGRLVMVGGKGIGSILARALHARVLSWFIKQHLGFFVATPNKEDLTLIGEFIALGKVTPIIDRWYRLTEIREAMRYLEEGHARGKVIISLESNQKH